MYANLHTFIFTFTLIFFHFRCKQRAKRLQKDCKKGKTKNSLSLSLRKSKTKTYHLIQGKASSAFPKHEEQTAPIIITDFIHYNIRNPKMFTSSSISCYACSTHNPKPLSNYHPANPHH